MTITSVYAPYAFFEAGHRLMMEKQIDFQVQQVAASKRESK